jgi:sugar lactone lactonase YvrE
MKTRFSLEKICRLLGRSTLCALLCLALFQLSMPATCQAIYPSPYTFTTFAGNTNPQVHSTWSFNPKGIAVDAAGNVYFADTRKQIICRINPSRAVTILAGKPGSIGSTDGIGNQARFHYPQGVALDAAGNIYVADSGNNTIRRVTPRGIVTTLAGIAGTVGCDDGTGCAARFNYPNSVAVDRSGNIFVADLYNNIIRKVTPSGVVTTLAGQPGISGRMDGRGDAARFNYPVSVAVDRSGNVYVADILNNAIRKITPGGVVTTLAGKLSYAVGNTDGTGNAARFCHPYGLVVDASGNIYVSDSGNHTIRCITYDGVVTTLAGLAGQSGNADGSGSAARFWHPTSLALDRLGNLYVADLDNASIRKGFAAPQTNTAFSLKTQSHTPATGYRE